MSSKSTLRSGPKSIYGLAAEKPILQNPRAFRFSFRSIADVDLMRMPARPGVITTGLVAVAVSVRVVRIVVGPVAVAADAPEMVAQSGAPTVDPTDVAAMTDASKVTASKAAAKTATTEAAANMTADVSTSHTTPHMAATAPATATVAAAAPATVPAASTAPSGKCICRSEASSQRHCQDGDQGHPLQTFVHVNSI